MQILFEKKKKKIRSKHTHDASTSSQLSYSEEQKRLDDSIPDSWQQNGRCKTQDFRMISYLRVKLWQVRVKLRQVRVKVWQVQVKLWQIRVESRIGIICVKVWVKLSHFLLPALIKGLRLQAVLWSSPSWVKSQ